MGSKSAAVHTNATKVLYRDNVPYAIHQYDDEPVGVNAGVGLPADAFDHPKRVFRTIVTLVDDDPIAALVPVDCVLDTDLAAAAVGAEGAVEADLDTASEVSGFPPQAISPLGTKSNLSVLIDVSALDFKTIYISAGEDGFTIELSPNDLVRLTNARTAPIARHL